MSQGNVLPLVSEKRINDVVSTLTTTKNHQRLLKALENGFQHRFVLMGQDSCESYSTSVRDAQGEVIHECYNEWLDTLYQTHHEDVHRVFRYLQACPYSLTKCIHKSVYLALPLSEVDSSQFIQIEIRAVVSEQETLLFKEIELPYGLDCLSDLDYPRAKQYPDNPRKFTDRIRYHFGSQERFDRFVYTAGHLDKAEHQQVMDNPPIIRVTRSDSDAIRYVPFLDLYPEQATYHACGTVRWVKDWYRCSAQAEPPYRHWYFEFMDSERWQTPPDQRTVAFIPQWLCQKMLPEIRVKPNDTIHTLLARLEGLDKKAGYAFAWFFFMVHGNRVNSEVGRFLVEHDGLRLLPDIDQVVLREWYNNPYGF